MSIDKSSVDIDIQQATARVGGLFDLVLITVNRAREIIHERSPADHHAHTAIVTALLEVAAGQVSVNYRYGPRKLHKHTNRRRY